MTSTGSIATGTQLGSYLVEDKLGEGGAGEVYRARDTKLRRHVAIKLLSEDLADGVARNRFLREAQTVSSFNHPHILTVHDIGEFNDRQYLVTEFVDGGTLRSWAERTKPSWMQVVELLVGVADALETAHRAGILHRDIKPENILVSTAGHAKLGDFGLAKLMEGAEEQVEPAITKTRTGIVMGTVAYMSPEQASGEPLDARSDIFSFGVVLYEMLAGHRPFGGSSDLSVLRALVSATPAPLPDHVPLLLRLTVEKALEKDAANRYQSMREMTVDLRRALREASGVSPSNPVSIDAKTRRPVRTRALVAGAVVLAIGAAAWLVSDQIAGRAPADPIAGATITRITDFPGAEIDADISRDGKFVAFLADRDGPFDLFVTQVGSGQFRNLTQAHQGELVEPTHSIGFTPDGSAIWIRGRTPTRPTGNPIRLMPLLGGDPKELLDAVMLNWSPDGTQMVFHRGTAFGDPIFVGDRNGGNPRQIYLDSAAGVHAHFVVWSPNGRWIYFAAGPWATREMDIWRVAPTGGVPERITNRHTDIRFPTLIDDRTMLFVSPAEDGSGPWLYALDVKTRKSTRIGVGVDQYRSIAASADGRRLVATVANPRSALWSIPIGDRVATENDAKQIALPTTRALAPRIHGDTVLYLAPHAGAGLGLWRLAHGQSEEIWNGAETPLDEPAAIAYDGKKIAVAVRGGGHIRLAIIDSTNGSRTIADSLDVRGTATWSPDGKWIAAGGQDSRGPGLFKVPLDGGPVVRLTKDAAFNPVWSPDGHLIVYGGAAVGVYQALHAVTPDGTPVSLPQINVKLDGERYRFTPDGKQLVYMQGFLRHLDFVALDLATKTERRLTQLQGIAAMRTFDISADGKRIIFDRQFDNSDIVLIERPR